MTPDIVNACFEVFGAIVALLNIHRLYYDRVVRGVSWVVTFFFTAWGCWNVWYYDFLLQPVSQAAAVCLVLVNGTWLAMLFYFAWCQQRCNRRVLRSLYSRKIL